MKRPSLLLLCVRARGVLTYACLIPYDDSIHLLASLVVACVCYVCGARLGLVIEWRRVWLCRRPCRVCVCVSSAGPSRARRRVLRRCRKWTSDKSVVYLQNVLQAGKERSARAACRPPPQKIIAHGRNPKKRRRAPPSSNIHRRDPSIVSSCYTLHGVMCTIRWFL